MTQFLERGRFQVFDQNEIFNDPSQQIEIARQIGDTVLQINQIVMDLASIERVPRFCVNRKENDAEHSLAVALQTIVVITNFFPGLDAGLGGQLAMVHDFPELKTGDISTFRLTDQQLQDKHHNDKAVLPQLLDELPPYLADLVEMYEEKKLPEAKVVEHIDKLNPNSVNIIGAGVAVMSEDFDITSSQQFLKQNAKNEKRFRERFPDDHHEPLHYAHGYLASLFAEQLSESL